MNGQRLPWQRKPDCSEDREIIPHIADQATVLVTHNGPGGCRCGSQTRRSPDPDQGFSQFNRKMEATGGFEPPNRGFADLRLRPLGYVAVRALYGAEGGTRTRTSLRTLRPQRSLSTNFSTPAWVITAADRVSIFIYLSDTIPKYVDRRKCQIELSPHPNPVPEEREFLRQSFVKYGRSGGIRTPDRWFWRPVL